MAEGERMRSGSQREARDFEVQDGARSAASKNHVPECLRLPAVLLEWAREVPSGNRINTGRNNTVGKQLTRMDVQFALEPENTESPFKQAGDTDLRSLELQIVFEVAQQVVQGLFGSTFLFKGAPRIDRGSSELRPGLFFLAAYDCDH
jgi:hypothetical protein